MHSHPTEGESCTLKAYLEALDIIFRKKSAVFRDINLGNAIPGGVAGNRLDVADQDNARGEDT
jgi:hypothetical protein